MNDLPIVIRPPREEDYPYILKSWSVEFHKVQPYNFIPNQFYFPWMKKRIDALCATSTILVACLDDSPDDIVGYIIASPYDNKNIILHWMQVKAIYRRLGVAKELLSHFEPDKKNIICTHYFKLFKTLKDKHHLIFDPTILEET